jgi:uncharacterized protein YecT (DUF1311 family)
MMVIFSFFPKFNKPQRTSILRATPSMLSPTGATKNAALQFALVLTTLPFLFLTPVFSAEKKSVAGCHAEDLYDDTKNASNSTAADWHQVHTCAMEEDDTATLMMLYANGFGVQRDLPLAIHYACRIDGAIAEVTARVDYLAAHDKDHQLPDFDICDHATSGFLTGLCSRRWERQESKLRDQRIIQIKQQLAPVALIKFNALNDAATAFAENRGAMETDLSGSLRASFRTEATSAAMKSFMQLLEILERDGGKTLPRINMQQAEQQLNRQYRKVMRSKNLMEKASTTSFASTISKQNVRQTQRSWLYYRDCWVHFAQARYPGLDPTLLSAYLTRQRIDQLAELSQ